MATPTSTQLKAFPIYAGEVLKNTLTPAQLTSLTNPNFVQLAFAQGGGDGSTDALSTIMGWLTAKPVATSYLTKSADLQTVIGIGESGSPYTTTANGLPDTYFSLHAETLGNEPKLDGLLALRSQAVDSTFKDSSPNIADNTGGGNALTDAYVMGLYATYGADKFKAIYNKGVIKAIMNESNTSYDTIAEVVAIYAGAWSNAVSKADFFAAFDKFYNAGYTGLKFSDLYGVANNLANFQKYTATNAIKLMASTGGSWSAVTGLGASEFTLLTSPNAARAIDKCGATYTSMDTVYTADATKAASLLSDNTVALCTKQYSGFNFAGLSTLYGTTYDYVADSKFNNLMTPEKHSLYSVGVTGAHAAGAAPINCLSSNGNLVNKVVTTGGTADGVFQVLVGATNLAGLETLGGGTTAGEVC